MGGVISTIKNCVCKTKDTVEDSIDPIKNTINEADDIKNDLMDIYFIKKEQ